VAVAASLGQDVVPFGYDCSLALARIIASRIQRPDGLVLQYTPAPLLVAWTVEAYNYFAHIKNFKN
jgi:hypothetical protein